jgi:hypothetical protein
MDRARRAYQRTVWLGSKKLLVPRLFAGSLKK